MERGRVKKTAIQITISLVPYRSRKERKIKSQKEK
jgi:hypothetical protein